MRCLGPIVRNRGLVMSRCLVGRGTVYCVWWAGVYVAWVPNPKFKIVGKRICMVWGGEARSVVAHNVVQRLPQISPHAD